MSDDQTDGLVSVIIPCYNGEAYLAEAIESVLMQDWEPIELIVVDDGSTDRSRAIAEGFGARLRCIYQMNAGLGAARNTGIQATRSEFLAFLDADDVWAPRKLAAQVAVLGAQPSLDGVFGMIENFQDGDEGARYEVKTDDGGIAYLASALCIRRESFMRAGLFWTQHALGEFLDWYGRAEEAGLRFGSVDQIVLRRRIHGANMTISGERSDYLQVLRATLERRRRADTLDA